MPHEALAYNGCLVPIFEPTEAREHREPDAVASLDHLCVVRDDVETDQIAETLDNMAASEGVSDELYDFWRLRLEGNSRRDAAKGAGVSPAAARLAEANPPACLVPLLIGTFSVVADAPSLAEQDQPTLPTLSEPVKPDPEPEQQPAAEKSKPPHPLTAIEQFLETFAARGRRHPTPEEERTLRNISHSGFVLRQQRSGQGVSDIEAAAILLADSAERLFISSNKALAKTIVRNLGLDQEPSAYSLAFNCLQRGALRFLHGPERSERFADLAGPYIRDALLESIATMRFSSRGIRGYLDSLQSANRHLYPTDSVTVCRVIKTGDMLKPGENDTFDEMIDVAKYAQEVFAQINERLLHFILHKLNIADRPGAQQTGAQLFRKLVQQYALGRKDNERFSNYAAPLLENNLREIFNIERPQPNRPKPRPPAKPKNKGEGRPPTTTAKVQSTPKRTSTKRKSSAAKSTRSKPKPAGLISPEELKNKITKLHPAIGMRILAPYFGHVETVEEEAIVRINLIGLHQEQYDHTTWRTPWRQASLGLAKISSLMDADSVAKLQAAVEQTNKTCIPAAKFEEHFKAQPNEIKNKILGMLAADACLSPREYRILEGLYGDGLRAIDIAREFGCTATNIQYSKHRIAAKLSAVNTAEAVALLV
jgi:DNA-binding CsgD family transcriptional regulator